MKISKKEDIMKQLFFWCTDETEIKHTVKFKPKIEKELIMKMAMAILQVYEKKGEKKDDKVKNK